MQWKGYVGCTGGYGGALGWDGAMQLTCQVEDCEDMLAEGWWFYNAVLIKYDAVNGVETVPQFMVFLKGLWEFVTKI